MGESRPKIMEGRPKNFMWSFSINTISRIHFLFVYFRRSSEIFGSRDWGSRTSSGNFWGSSFCVEIFGGIALQFLTEARWQQKEILGQRGSSLDPNFSVFLFMKSKTTGCTYPNFSVFLWSQKNQQVDQGLFLQTQSLQGHIPLCPPAMIQISMSL